MSPTPRAIRNGRTRGTLRVGLPGPCSPHSSLGSSDPSPQSSSPSHFQRAGMHLPESLHRNSSTPQVICAGGRNKMTRIWGGEMASALPSHISFPNASSPQPGAARSTPAWYRRGRMPPVRAVLREEHLDGTDPGRTTSPAAHSTCSSAGTEQGPSSRRQMHAGNWPQRSSWCLEPPSPLPAGCLLQLAGSSEPSTQSLSRSHTQTRGMQRLVMAHWNWLGAQVTSAAGGEAESGEAAGRQGSASHYPTKTTPQCREAHRRSRNQSKAPRPPW